VLRVVRGTVYNYYSYGHKTLHLFRTVTFKTPLGIGPLLAVANKDKASEKQISKYEKLTQDLRIKNINASNPPPEVLKYKKDFDKMLYSVDFQK